MLEEHVDDIEDWFFHHQANDKSESTPGLPSASLENYLCRQGRVLKSKEDRLCLDKVAEDKPKKKSKRTKGETGDTAKKEDSVHTEL